jgi:diguanylate cyclase (GGDEF)-like protein/PAS domain S-box-containing protein
LKPPEQPLDEESRLRELHATCLLDSGNDSEFDAITRAVAEVIDVPIALVSLVDRERQWFKSKHGLSAAETPREVSFCAHVVAEGAALVVEDARTDARFADNPLVVGAPFVVFYAGFPVVTPTGRVLGTVCAIDHEPRTLAPHERLWLASTAKHVSTLVELRTQALVHEAEVRDLADTTLSAVIGVAKDQTICWVSWRAAELLGVPTEALVGRSVASLFCDETDYAALSARLRDVGTVRRCEAWLRAEPGATQQVLIDADQPLWSREGAYRRFILTDGSETATRAKTVECLVTLFGHSRDLVCTADETFRLDHLNTSWGPVLGWTDAELRAESFLSFVDPADRSRTRECIAGLYASVGSVVEFKHRVNCKDGAIRSLSWVGTVHRGMVFAVARDVTAQVAATARVEFNNRLLRLIADAQVEFISPGTTLRDWWTRVLDGLIAATGSEYGFIGTVERDAKGRHLRTKAITNISWDDETRALYRKEAEQGLVFRNLNTLFGRVIVDEKTIVSNDVANDPRAGGRPPGHPPLDAFVGLACGTGDNLVGMVGLANRKGGYDDGIVSDLAVAGVFVESVINQLASAARGSAAEARLSAVINSTVDAIATTDEDGVLVTVNAAFEHLFGYTPAEAVGKHLAFVLEPPFGEPNGEPKTGSERIDEKPTIGSGRVASGRRKDGSRVPIELTITGFSLDETQCFTAILRDLTVRVKAEQALQDAAVQLSSALDIARAGHWYYDVSSDQFTFNEGFFKLFRTTVEAVGSYQLSAAEYATRFVHPEDSAIVGREVRAALEAGDPKYSRQLEHRFLYADGMVGFLAVRFFVDADVTGRVTRLYGVVQDITERRQQELEIAGMQAQQKVNEALARKVGELDRSRLLSALTSDCVELVQRCISLSEGVEVIARFVERMYPDANVALYGQDDVSDELVLRTQRRSFGDSDEPSHMDPTACWAVRTRRPYAVWRGGTHLPCVHSPSNGPGLSMCAPLLSLDRMVGLICVALPMNADDDVLDHESITGRVAHFEATAQSLSGALSSISLRESLQRLAMVDELTGLPNRRAFSAGAQRVLARRRRTGEAVAVAMLDIDYFKKVNDVLGHDEGDRLLKRLAKVMIGSFRAEDVLGRFGGEEFVLLMAGASSADVERHLNEFRLRVRELCVFGGEEVTISIGFVHSDDVSANALDEMVRLADVAMYAAKRGGRDRVVRGPVLVT